MATQEDPLSRIYDLDSRSMGRGLVIGLLGALCVHAAGATEASHLADSMGGWALDTRSRVHGYLAHLYDVELVEAPPPPPPPPEEPAPEPEAPKPAPVAAKTAPTEKAPPPAPAQAGAILTQAPDPDAPVDLTGAEFVTGNSETYAGGVTANNGTSTKAVRNLGAAAGGALGGTGNTPGAAVLSGPDLSRAPSLLGGTEWACDFPAEADADQIDFQRVQIIVTVRPDGTAQDVRVAGKPAHGFGRQARQCALGKKWNPGTDRQGQPILSSTPPINVTFKR